MKQEVLRKIKSVIYYTNFSESLLEFAPRWVIDKSVTAEKENWADAKEEVHIRNLPPQANLISSHHFFTIKFGGQGSKLKLRCRLVLQFNLDCDKNNIRNDSSTAQFYVIRVILYTAALLGLPIASVDTKKTYLQSVSLLTDIYVQPPNVWAL